MGFVVRATSRTGAINWISPPGFADIRVLGPREDAEIFGTWIEANAAIDSMPVQLERDGVRFTVEPAE
jgi:hypothetical protein